jgi:hypothetical protein
MRLLSLLSALLLCACVQQRRMEPCLEHAIQHANAQRVDGQ